MQGVMSKYLLCEGQSDLNLPFDVLGIVDLDFDSTPPTDLSVTRANPANQPILTLIAPKSRIEHRPG